MNKSLPAAGHYTTFDRIFAQLSAEGVQGMNSCFTCSTADCGLLASGSELEFFVFWKKD
jgi:hypothetical protein